MTETEEVLVEQLEDYREQLSHEKIEMLKEMVKKYEGEDEWFEAAKEVINTDRFPSDKSDEWLRKAVLPHLENYFNPNYDIIDNEHIDERYSKILEALKRIKNLQAITGDSESHRWGGFHDSFSLGDEEKIEELASKFEEFPNPEERKLTNEELDEIVEFIKEFFETNVLNSS